MYETLWARSLALMFGSTVQANAAIFAGFIIGLAIGAAVFGWRIQRWRNPAKLYGWVEFAIAVTAITVGLILFQYRNEWILGGGRDLAYLLRAAGAVVLLILVPAGLMGGTLPILLHLARQTAPDQTVVGRVYAWNVIGAAMGTLLCGFFAIPQLGIIGTHFLAGLLNVVAGALIIGRQLSSEPTGEESEKQSDPTGSGEASSPPEWTLLVTVFVSGFAVYAVEVLWSRLAHYFIGNRIFAFSILLSSILCLLAIGARISSVLIHRFREKLSRGLGFMMLTAAIGLLMSALGSHQLILMQSEWESSFPNHTRFLPAYRFLETLIVLGPSVITLGILFPICLVLSKRAAKDIAASTGRYYVFNAAGSVLGSIAAGFVLLAWFGVYRSIVLVLWILIFVSYLFFVHSGLRGRKIQACIGVSLGTIIGATGMIALPSELMILQTGDERISRREDEYGIFQIAKLPKPRRGMKRVTNNRTELVYHYGSKSTRRVQGMQGHLGMIYNPDAKFAVVLGSGYGITAGEMSLYPQLERIDAVEILPGMIAAADQFEPDNRSYHRKDKVRVVQDDGRHFLAHSDETYDVVSINLTDPRTPGSGSLFHADFLEIIKAGLNPKGVVVLHVFGADRGLQLRTIAHVFPHWLAFRSYGNGFNVVASADPLLYEDRRVKAMMANTPEIGRSLRRFKFDASEALERKALAKHFNNPHLICTDNFPLLEYSLQGDMKLLLESNE
jgi:spermidine synthase